MDVTDSIFIILKVDFHVFAQSFNEGETNMRIAIMTCQIKFVTRGRGEVSPVLSQKFENCPDFGKIYLVVTFYGLNL